MNSEISDTSLMRTTVFGPVVSTIERFHCTSPSHYIRVQWNLSIVDASEPRKCVLIREEDSSEIKTPLYV